MIASQVGASMLATKSRIVGSTMAFCAQYPQVTVLRGNHEEMMLKALVSEAAFHQWLTMGGDATYRAYCPPTRRLRWDLFVRLVSPEVRAFLERMPYWYCNTDACYAHAGARRDETGRWIETGQQTTLWSRSDLFPHIRWAAPGCRPHAHQEDP